MYRTAPVWTTYEIQSGDLEGWGLEPGCFLSANEGDQENSFRLPSFVRTDAAIYYRRNNGGSQFQKSFDVDYIRSSAERPFILVSLLLSSAQYR